ncbi:glycoside hydrolase [Choiromyces venosus 120613-1]|uniref:Alpha-galactosidase n=1 Tax=Choiromyces venosus 120613-1 TaxID=1336337 RepID=A0A3N4JAJ4_9PEZI|nr:glycoside hydrolase [Choiromyces venosus 120613-1]
MVKANAKAMADLGLAAAGYECVVPDCGWSAKERTAEGEITWNETFCPSGYPASADYVHGLNLKFGIHSGARTYQCHPEGGNYLIQASLGMMRFARPKLIDTVRGHEQSDAETFAEWGGVYLK